MTQNPWARGSVAAVLFDFDGTLADTAPDLAGAVNAMRRRRQLPELALDRLRPWASAGARGLIGAGFGIAPSHEDYAAMREEFLAEYASTSCVATRLFDGMARVLGTIESAGLRWGIVTNKVGHLTAPIVHALGLNGRAAAVVSGDTTAHIKPHPAPLLHAADQIGVPAADCAYVGDDERDIAAGRAAGMRTIAAAWGYCSQTDPRQWAADAVIEVPSDLIELLGLVH